MGAFCDASVYQELQQKRHARTQETGRLKASTPPNAPPVKLECDAEGIPRDMHPGSGTDSDHTVSSRCTGHPAKPWAPGLMCLPHWAQQDEPREVHFFRFSVRDAIEWAVASCSSNSSGSIIRLCFIHEGV